MIAQSALRPASPSARAAAPRADDAPARRPASEADALLGALLYNWSIQRIALTLTLPAAQIGASEGLVARLRKSHDITRQPLSLSVLLAEGAAAPGLTARIRFDEALTPARVTAYLSRHFPDLTVTAKRDTSDRAARTVVITLA